MPAATDLRKDVLRSVHRRLNDLARRIVLRSESRSPASQPSHRRDADPFGPLFNVLEALNSEQKGFHTRLEQLEDALSPAAAPAHGADVFGPLIDALEALNCELNESARRLAELESCVPYVLHRPGISFRHSSATLRAARSRRVRKGASRA